MSRRNLGVDVINSPWAIVPEKLWEISEIYCKHLRGEDVDIALIEAELGKELKNEETPFQMIGDIAVVKLNGVLAKKMNFLTQISGGTSTQLLKRDFAQAMNDPLVNKIILHIDSPGGSVDGTQSVVDLIFESRGKGKPIIAFADGAMASAAYWIGSAADRVIMGDNTTSIGSIGVVATHIDHSKQNEKMGIKVTEITSGKFKRVVSEHTPLSKEGKATIQENIDQIYSVFVESVARNRGVSVEAVLENMADGKVFVGQRGVDAGLADGILSFEALVSALLEGSIPTFEEPKRTPKTEGGGEMPAPAKTEMNKEEREVVINDAVEKFNLSEDANSAIVSWVGEMKTEEERDAATNILLSSQNVTVADISTTDDPVSSSITIGGWEYQSTDNTDWPWLHNIPQAAGDFQIKLETIAPPKEPETKPEGEPEPKPVEPEGKKPEVQPTLSGEGEGEMKETEIREILGAKEGDDVRELLEACAATRKIVASQGSDSVISLIDHNIVKQKLNSAQKMLAEKEIEISDLNESHDKKIRQRDADELVKAAIADGKINESMRQVWADDLAFRDPGQFKSVIKTLGKMVHLDEEGGGEPQLVSNAKEEFKLACDLVRQDAQAKGETLKVAEVHDRVIEKNKGLYDRYIEEIRGESRGRE